MGLTLAGMSTPPPRGYVFAATDLTQSRLRGLTRVVKELPPWRTVGRVPALSLLRLRPHGARHRSAPSVFYSKGVDFDVAPTGDEIASVRRFIHIELGLLALMPLMAVLMARGIGR